MFIKPGKASVIVDGQFGSTGKGNIAAYFATRPDVEIGLAVTSSAPNSGHTAIVHGKKYVTHHLPMVGVLRDCPMILGPQSVINPAKLLEEIDANEVKVDRLCIHPNAVILTDEDVNAESFKFSKTTTIGSTRQGVGAAQAKKIWRNAEIAADSELSPWCKRFDINEALMTGVSVLVEVPQGFSLGIDEQFYPYCTSRNCRVTDGLAYNGIHPRFIGDTCMTLRTYPIRVGNIYDEDNNQLGYSGDHYHDQKEIQWEGLGVVPEVTTVTGRVRRVFTFSFAQLRDAVRSNQPNTIFLNFVNYIKDDKEKTELIDRIKLICLQETNRNVTMLFGHGPDIKDISYEIC